MIYAIVDIETTGGHAAANGITEVAVYLFDGESVVDRFETLLNPFQPIPAYVQALTGITNEMVQLAPAFSDVAPKLYAMLQGKVFVAHNVNFDYTFLLHAFRREGFRLQCPRLCTVRYARKVLPGLSSYSLGNICRRLGIAVHNRHRAGGDAFATLQLFQYLQARDVQGIHLQAMLRRQSKDQYLPMHLQYHQVENLPEVPGVYYFHDAKDKVIYVGKAKNLRKRVASHFSNHHPGKLRQTFLLHVHRISYQICGTEMMAQILETIEIKRLWPKYNRAMKGVEARYALYTFEDNAGYLRLAVERKKKHLPALHIFGSRYEGLQMLRKLIAAHALCEKLCFLQLVGEEACSNPACNGACRGQEAADAYNRRVLSAIRSLQQELSSFLIRLPSVTSQGDCCFLVEKGRFYGMGYATPEDDSSAMATWKEKLTPYPEYDFIRQHLYRFAQANPQHVFPLN